MNQSADDFKDWMDARGLNAAEVAKDLGTEEQTVRKWRSQGVPDRRRPHVERYMAEWIDPSASGTQDTETSILRIEFDDEEIDLVSTAAGIVDTPIRDFIRRAAVHQARVQNAEADHPAKPALPENLLTFPEIPLIHAAAGSPITTDGDTFAPTRKLGAGRFAVQLHGDSMEPRFKDGSIVILRERDSLKKPIIKRGEVYLFDVSGEKTLKIYESRIATTDEIESGITYVSPRDGKTKVRVLRSINPDYSEIVITDDVKWIGWLDKKDNA